MSCKPHIGLVQHGRCAITAQSSSAPDAGIRSLCGEHAGVSVAGSAIKADRLGRGAGRTDGRMTKRKTPQKIDLTPRTLAFDPVKVEFDRPDRTPLCNATSKGRYTGPRPRISALDRITRASRARE